MSAQNGLQVQEYTLVIAHSYVLLSGDFGLDASLLTP